MKLFMLIIILTGNGTDFFNQEHPRFLTKEECQASGKLIASGLSGFAPSILCLEVSQ